MKLKILYSIALLTGLFCMGVAQAQTFSPPWDSPITGYLIVYADESKAFTYWDGGAAGTDITGPYALENLRSLTSDTLTFDFLPETNKYWNGDNAESFWQNGSGDGGKYLDSLTFWNRALSGAETNALIEFTVNSNTLDTDRYEFVAFVKTVNTANGQPYQIVETNLNGQTGSFSLELAITGTSPSGAPLQAGFRISGTNANPANAASYGGANVTVTFVDSGLDDGIPPDPSPLTWVTAPYTISDDKIGMTVTTATDISNPVQYQFFAYKGASIPGDGYVGTSGLVEDPHYVFEGLLPNQQYTFRARAQDSFDPPNVGGFTPNGSATTIATDTTAPSTANIASMTASPISLWMVATPATDASLVEYNFVPANTNNNAVASGWQTSNEYVAYGLVPDTAYSYTVTVRDLSAATNSVGPSAPSAAFTLAAPASVGFTNDLKGFTAGTTPSGAVLTELANAGFEVASFDPAKPITASGSGLQFGTDGSATFNDRNILRTIASDYADNSFQITVTCAYSNLIEQVLHVGVGHGLQGQYNVPDFFLTGVSGVLSETSNAGQKLFGWFEGALQDIAETTGGSNLVVSLVNRVRLTYDASTTNATYEIDYDADGAGGFAADFTLGPISLTNVWQTGAPQKVYIGGGAGSTLYDLEVVYAGSSAPIAVDDLTILSVSGDTATLQWTGLSGQSYSVQYKTDLGAATWTTDSTGITGAGVLTPTATVPGTKVFYQVISE